MDQEGSRNGKAGQKLTLLWQNGKRVESRLDQSFVFTNEDGRSVKPAEHEQARLIEEIGKNPYVDSAIFTGIQVETKLTIRLKERGSAPEKYLDVCLEVVRLIRNICQADVTVTTTLCAYLTRESREC